MTKTKKNETSLGYAAGRGAMRELELFFFFLLMVFFSFFFFPSLNGFLSCRTHASGKVAAAKTCKYPAVKERSASK